MHDSAAAGKPLRAPPAQRQAGRESDSPLPAGLRVEVRERVDALVRFRRELHRHPELGYEEVRTAGRVAERLRDGGFDVETGIAATGLFARIGSGGEGRRAVLFRADMDALPVQEESGAEYASEIPGRMHACGHDAHMAILTETALLARSRMQGLAGDLAFLFQPAEEGQGGARRMIEEGVLERTRAEAAFGLHVWSQLPFGTVAVTAGPFMAAADEFRIILQGRGGHAAFPHESIDTVLAASHLVTALQSIVARSVDPLQSAVVTVGHLQAGSGHNIIAERAELHGTLRAFRPEIRTVVRRRLREVTEGVAATFGTACEVQFLHEYPPVVNDAALAEFVAEVAGEVIGRDNVIRDLTMMGSEDMAFFLEKIPGCFFFVGSGNEARGLTHPHHSPRFDIDERVLPLGCELFLRLAERYFDRFPERPRLQARNAPERSTRGSGGSGR